MIDYQELAEETREYTRRYLRSLTAFAMDAEDCTEGRDEVVEFPIDLADELADSIHYTVLGLRWLSDTGEMCGDISYRVMSWYEEVGCIHAIADFAGFMAARAIEAFVLHAGAAMEKGPKRIS